MLRDSYRVVAGPMYSPAHLALAPRYQRMESAVAAMGAGMVVTDSGRLVAFHERHLTTIERLAALNSEEA